MRYVVAFLCLAIAGCTTNVKPSVVTSVVDQKNVQIPAVSPPSAFKPATFKFQRPEDKNAVVALDLGNYNLFRSFMLSVNKRELEWSNKLEQANRSLMLLQGLDYSNEKDEIKTPTQ